MIYGTSQDYGSPRRVDIIRGLTDAFVSARWEDASYLLSSESELENAIIFCEYINPNTWQKQVNQARQYATEKHYAAKHYYDTNKPYAYHLNMAFEFGKKYKHLLPEEAIGTVLSGVWVHDIIEDARESYNDVRKVLGVEVAEIAYACTNEKGRTPEERANDKYYAGIKNNPYATFTKICDRMANVKYGVLNQSRQLQGYKQQQQKFKLKIWNENYKEMFDELDKMLS